MKNKFITYLSIFMSAIFIILFAFSEYRNSQLQRQIIERDAFLNRMDSIIGFYANASYEEESIIFKFPIDRYGNKLNFKDLDSIRYMNERIIAIQDEVIKFAKKKYNFNYSTKVIGDSLRIYMWDKP